MWLRRSLALLSLATLTATATLTGCSLLIPSDATGGSPGREDSGPLESSTPPQNAPVDASSIVDAGDTDARAPELPGLIGYWSFDEEAANSAADRSGAGHDALLIGGPLFGGGILGTGLRSDGADDRMRVDALNGLAFPQSGTFSVWFRADSADGQWILDQYDTERDHLFLTIDKSEGLHVRAVFLSKTPDGVGATRFAASAPVTLGVWMHVVVVWDTVLEKASFYANGVLTETASVVGGWEPRQQLFELFRSGCCGGFKGTIDEMRLYNRPLTVAEVAKVP